MGEIRISVAGRPVIVSIIHLSYRMNGLLHYLQYLNKSTSILNGGTGDGTSFIRSLYKFRIPIPDLNIRASRSLKLTDVLRKSWYETGMAKGDQDFFRHTIYHQFIIVTDCQTDKDNCK